MEDKRIWGWVKAWSPGLLEQRYPGALTHSHIVVLPSPNWHHMISSFDMDSEDD